MYDTALSIIEQSGLSKGQVALVALLLFGLASFIIGRIWVYFQTQGDDSLDEYMRLPVAWPSIFVVWAGAALALGWAYALLPDIWVQRIDREIMSDPQKQLFLVYLIGFASMWFVYLLSRSDNPILRAKSLRRLLMTCSMHWHEEPPEKIHEDDVIRLQRDKAGSAITSIAIQIAAAAVILGMIQDAALQASAGVTLTLWQESTLALAAASAIIAFYCFVVAADVLETIFNRFRPAGLHVKIVGKLYDYAINPKYYGLIFLISSVALFAAAMHPLFGALSLATATFIGYGHWFPRLRPRQGLERLEWILRIGIVALPAALVFRAL
jgi:hypothetical protein